MVAHLTSDDVAQWAGHQKSAEALLPELVRVLVRSQVSAADIARISFPSGKGINSGGFDGTLEVRAPNSFAKTARSVWELSVEQRPGTKAKSDYEARFELANPDTTYIQVSGRHWAGKEKWAAARRKEGAWADVVAYDASDLSAWLGESVAATAWLAAQMHRSVPGVMSGAFFLSNWLCRSDPNLLPRVLLAGRGAELRKMRDWLRGSPSPLMILSDTRDEAVACALAAAGMRGKTALVVSAEAAWTDLVPVMLDEDLPSFVIPAFAGFDGSTLLARRHHLLIPIERGQQLSGGKIAVRLDPVPREALSRALTRSGLESSRAAQVSGMSGGKLSSVQRMLGYFIVRPAWLAAEDSRMLGAVLLVGAWNQRCEADRSVLTRLSGGDWGAFESMVGRLLGCADAPLRMIGNVVRFRSAKDAWMLLSGALTASLLDEFASLCGEVLSLPDPRYDMPQDERIYASIQGKTPANSAELRLGLCNSLAWLVLHADAVDDKIAPRSAQGIVDAIVQRLLSGDWRVWTSLGDGLRSVAESAPDALLDSVRLAATTRSVDIEPIFAQDSSSSIFSCCAHTHLLWALESLAWNERLFPLVALVLSTLCRLDRGGSYSNRPFSSLQSLFLPHIRLSNIPPPGREVVLERVVAGNPDTGWRLLLAIGDSYSRGGIIMDNARPRFLPWPLPPEFDQYGNDVIRSFQQKCLLLTKQAIDERPARLADVSGTDHHRFLGLREVARLIRAHRDGLVAEDAVVARIRRNLRGFYKFSRHEKPEILNLVDELLRELEPPDPVARNAWLFALRPNLSGFGIGRWKEEQEEVARMRQKAIDEVTSDTDADQALERLTKSAEEASTIGHTLAYGANRERHAALMARFSVLEDEKLRSVAAGYWAVVTLSGGCKTFIEALNALLLGAGIEKTARIAAEIPSTPELRDWVEGQDETFALAYWHLVRSVRCSERDGADFSRIVARLLAARRWGLALEIGRDALQTEGLGTLNDFLALLRHGPSTTPEEQAASNDSMFSWTVGKLFERISGMGFSDRSEQLALEMFYLPIFEHSEWQPQTIRDELDASPEFFVAVLRLMFRADGEVAPTDEVQRQRRSQQARTAFEVLRSWGSHPGAALNQEERDAALRSWCRRAMTLCREIGRGPIGDRKIGEMLARVPTAESDGVWPCTVARDFVEEGGNEIGDGLESGRINGRGFTTRSPGDGGDQERELAQGFRRDAEVLRSRWPLTAGVLDKLAKHFEFMAKHVDDDDAEFRDPWVG